MQQDDESPLSSEELSEQLHRIIDEMLAPWGKSSPRGQPNILDPNPMPFSINKPNEHDTKAEFQRELDAVRKSIAKMEEIFELLLPRGDSEDDTNLRLRLQDSIDRQLRNAAPPVRLDEAYTVVRKMVAESGGFYGSIWILLDFSNALKLRLSQLEEQRKLFWNLRHRAPDHYARTIALRLAKVFASQTEQRPTLGTSGETGDPSTSYTKALKEVFQLLNIETGVRSPADWAVNELTEMDMNPHQRDIISALMGLPSTSRTPGPSLLDMMDGNPEESAKE
ncbi:hypothetical protein [Roseovarius indicus]|uniref:hypothetical protein n=1 Tax=Roseovarius indicus TaxID=540747 RepID=UPI0032F04B0D